MSFAAINVPQNPFKEEHHKAVAESDSSNDSAFSDENSEKYH
jgi:hypothetical protein